MASSSTIAMWNLMMVIFRYLIDNHWYKSMKGYVGLDPGGPAGSESANPGPVDNTPLYKEDKSDIRDHMIDELDYTLVPEEAWTLLVERFGLEVLGNLQQ